MTVEAITSVMGGSKTLKRKIATSPELVAFTREGIPAATLSKLAEGLTMDRRSVARAVGISERTLSRRLHSQSRLSAEESDRTIRLARIFALSTDVLSTRENAARWLQEPNRALDGRTPFELLDTDTGVQEVETILGRIMYGLFS